MVGSKWLGVDEMIAIADAGSFVGASRLLRVSTSHVSRVVAELERSLGAPLFARTTRRVSLTDTGRALVDHCRRLSNEREEAFALVAGDGTPQGELRITCPISLGERFLAPIVRRFAELYPRVSVHLNLSNRLLDLVGEGYDLAIRTGHPSDDRLVARRVAWRRSELCAAPAYLARKGTPSKPSDLDQHDCLVGTSALWRFTVDGRTVTHRPSARWHCNSGSVTTDAAVAGMGICWLPSFYVEEHLEAKRLERLLTDYRAGDEAIYAVYPHRRHLLPKVAALVDMIERDLPGVMASPPGSGPAVSTGDTAGCP